MEFAMKLKGHIGLIALACVAGTAFAQQVYRQVDANGKVTYTDQAPTARTAQPVRSGNVTSLPVDGSLPFELRQVVQRYPVTLYTRDECQPCDAGRALLTTRGVPFTERSVLTAPDNDALQRLTGQNSLPVLAIGAQQLKGFQDSEWTQYLDAAGYPPSSRLPAGFRVPTATPLVAQVPAAAPPQAAAPVRANPVPAPAPSGPTADNPAGIKF
jgi:glutaredoxin